MASGPIISWQIERDKVEAVTDFIFLGSKITVDGGCSHEIKRCLLLGKKAMTNLDSVLKSRDIILPTKSIHSKLWRRQWHPIPVLLPGKSHGWRSLEGCSPWGRWGSDTTSLSLSLFTFMDWRRKWQPTPVFLPGESQGRQSLVGCHLWGCAQSDTTEVT